MRFLRLSNGASNFYLVEDGGRITVVDAGTPRDWPRLLRALDVSGFGIDSVDCILLTHAHRDHTGFAEQARREAGIPVHVHPADDSMAHGGIPQQHEGSMSEHLLHPAAYRLLFGLAINRAMKLVPIAETRSFSDGETLDVPGSPRVVHVPGHTDGSCSLFFEHPAWIVTGDALVTYDPLGGQHGPRIMPAALNHDSAQALESLQQLAATHARLVLPGHGEIYRDGVESAVQQARAARPG